MPVFRLKPIVIYFSNYAMMNMYKTYKIGRKRIPRQTEAPNVTICYHIQLPYD